MMDNIDNEEKFYNNPANVEGRKGSIMSIQEKIMDKNKS
jgi:hypothetical protein